MTCIKTLDSMISHLACSLNDNEGTELKRIAEKSCGTGGNGIDLDNTICVEELDHIRWSEKFLTTTINDAFRILHMERPDLFTARRRVKLTPGCKEQQLPECCKFAGKLRNATTCDDDSKPIKISDSQLRSSEAMGKLFCTGVSTDKEYSVKGYSFDPKSPHEITINPTPPHGEDTYVSFNCVDKAPCFTWDEDKDTEVLSCVFEDYHPWFVEYALFRTHMSDRESETSRQIAAVHWDNGFKLINDGKESDYAFYHPDLYLMGPIAEGTGERIVLQPE